MALPMHLIKIDLKFSKRASHHARREVGQFDWSIVIPQWEKLLAMAAKGQGQ